MKKKFLKLYIVLLMTCGSSLSAQGLNDLFKTYQRQNAEGSLAIMGLVGIPDDSASTIFLESGNSNRSYDFRSAQMGSGFRFGENVPIYLEGYLGYARYDPVLTVRSAGQTSVIPLKWTSVVATGGAGWEFDLGEKWKFRPLAHISIGRTQSDASIGAQAITTRLGIDRDFVESGGIWAGGLGASATLAFDHRRANDHQLEMQFRSTYIEYYPVGDDADLVVSSTAANAVLWSRYRFPTGWNAFQRPVRGVTDFSFSYLIGDQAQVLDTNWLARLGVGLELDVTETKIPWVTSARFMVRYYGSDTVNGYTAGFSISF